MIVELAQVIAVEDQYVLVQTSRQSACDNCSVNKGCGSSVLSKLVGVRFMQMKLLNKVGAKIGDTVKIGLQEAGLLKSALLIYAWPLLCMPLFIGLANLMNDSSLNDGAAILTALMGLAFGVLTARILSARLAQDPAFYPIVLSVERFDPVSSSTVFAP